MKLAGPVALVYSFITIYLQPVAALVNRTIDDQFGDSVTGVLPVYSPVKGAWNDQKCGGCAIKADVSRAFMQTYSAATYNPSLISMGINMHFSGTAIYVFFILANNQGDGITTLTYANFSVDSELPVSFLHTPNLSTTAFEYDSLVFSRTNLSNGNHSLDITTTGSTNIYVNFDHAIYTYDDSVSTTTSSLSSLSTVKTTSPASSTTVTGAPARRTPVGAIVGGIAGGIMLLAFFLSLLFCWRRRHGAFQSVRENGVSEPPITQFDVGGGSLSAPASGMPYTQPFAVRSKPPMATVTVSGGESSNTDNQATMRNRNRTLHSRGVVLLPPGYQQLSSSEKVSLSSTSNSNVLGTSSNNSLLPPPLNARGTREEVRRARQEDLDNRLRVVQHNIVQLEESSAGPGRSVPFRRQTSGEAGIIEEETQMSMPDMQEAIRLLKEQVHILREQQQSAWALGLSNDPPPGYTTMEVAMPISREASS